MTISTLATPSATSNVIPPISSPGIGSNLNVNSIITQLMAVASQPLNQLNAQEASYQAELSAFGTVSNALSTFQTSMNSLSTVSQFQQMQASSSNTSVISATAGSGAIPGNYNLSVTQLAASQKLVSAGQASETASIGSGATTTLTFDFGTISGGSFTAYNGTAGTGTYSGATYTSSGNGTKTVTIGTNNSLDGIAQAINNANIGVTASVINDGSGTNPYHLVLTSNSLGAANSMNISVSGDATLASLLTQNPAGTQDMSESVTAANSSFTLDGLAISRATNTVTDAINGLTLNLAGTGSTSVSVSNDPASVTSSVNSFVSAYNALNTALSGLDSYNSTTSTAGQLLGDPTVNQIVGEINTALNSSVTGLTSGFANLADIGVSFQKDGSLAVDQTTLNNAISTNFNGIAQLFAQTGSATDPLIQYVSGSGSTQPGSYSLAVSQLATQGSATGNAAANLTITQGSNDTLDLSVNGTNASVVIPAGTYANAAALATAVQSAINGNSALSGGNIKVNVTQNSGVLTLTSNTYGSASTVDITGGDGETGLFGTPTSTAGVDVQGTINGVAATGSGQYLSVTGTNSASGLSVQVLGGVTGNRGNINYSTGFAYQLNQMVQQMTDPLNGLIVNATNGINNNIADIESQKTFQNQQLSQLQQQYQQQYTALDVLVGQLTSTSTFLTSQLNSIVSMPNYLSSSTSGG
ncbi:MAG: flagellar filament capping protein FliD [Pseudomonadota bacterium]|nr:flagellar filament capping protein FliD [Pseudomonadota bacterium]